MSEINIKIEGVSYKVEEGLTILEAAKKCGYEIPSLCAYNHGECSRGSCRVCLVEATGARGLVASCVYPEWKSQFRRPRRLRQGVHLLSCFFQTTRQTVSSAIKTNTASFCTLRALRARERVCLREKKPRQPWTSLRRPLFAILQNVFSAEDVSKDVKMLTEKVFWDLRTAALQQLLLLPKTDPLQIRRVYSAVSAQASVLRAH